jgi:hypothetical protein
MYESEIETITVTHEIPTYNDTYCIDPPRLVAAGGGGGLALVVEIHY